MSFVGNVVATEYWWYFVSYYSNSLVFLPRICGELSVTEQHKQLCGTLVPNIQLSEYKIPKLIWPGRDDSIHQK